MKIKLLNWNTQLYEYGNIGNKTVEKGKSEYSNIIDYVKKHFDKPNKDEIPIAILQEIPYKIKEQGKWNFHEIYKNFERDFENNEFDIIYLKDEGKNYTWHIKMTVVIAPKNMIEPCKNISNIFVPFKISKYNANIYVLGVHSHNAYELREWLDNNQEFILIY